MSKNKTAICKAELKGFSGIDILSRRGDKIVASDIRNFRILPDNSLCVREGYRLFSEFENDIRAVFTGYIEGVFTEYVLSGSSLYRVEASDGTKVLIGNIGTSSGKASIFYYIGHIYVADGYEIYDVTSDGISEADGYTPLFGKDWDTLYMGDINEPLNLLHSRARISYIVGDIPNIFIPTLYRPASIEALYINGNLIDVSEYSISEEINGFSVSGIETGDQILVYLTFESDVVDKSKLVKNTEAVVFGGISNSRVFMWGGEDKSTLFCSAYASKENIAESQRVYGERGALYFPANYDFRVGDGRYSVSAVSRHYDRLLIFTEGDTWMADSDSSGVESFPVMRINVESGCISSMATAKFDNEPVSVGRHKILRWRANTDELEDCNSYSISDEIEAFLPQGFFEQAIAHEDRQNEEMLFAKRHDELGRVFVYGKKNKQWYIYDGIAADSFFDAPDSVGFVFENKMYVFDRMLSEDIVSQEVSHKIDAMYQTSATCFSHPFEKKRLKKLEFEGELLGGSVDIILETGDKTLICERIEGSLGQLCEVYKKRISADRFYDAKISIVNTSGKGQRIYGLSLFAKV